MAATPTTSPPSSPSPIPSARRPTISTLVLRRTCRLATIASAWYHKRMASLTITESPGGQAGKQFVLKHRPIAGGRHPSQEIQLLDAEVSRRHFLIRAEGDDHIITE